MYFYTGFPKLSWFDDNVILFTSREQFQNLLDSGKPVFVNIVSRKFDLAKSWNVAFNEAAIVFGDVAHFVQVEENTDAESALFRIEELPELDDFPFAYFYWVPPERSFLFAFRQRNDNNQVFKQRYDYEWSNYGFQTFFEDKGLLSHRRSRWPFV